MSTIDELLRHEEDAPASVDGRPSGSALGWLVKTIGYAAALGGLLLLALRLADLSMPYLLAFTMMLALLLVRRLVRLAAAPPSAPAAMVRRSSAVADEVIYRRGLDDGVISATSRWNFRLGWGHDSADRFTRTVWQRLVELTDERLRLRHGISRQGEPERARALLGEPLWTFLDAPVGKPPTPRELALILTRMEEL